MTTKAFPAWTFRRKAAPPCTSHTVVAALQALPVLRVRGVAVPFDKHVTWPCRVSLGYRLLWGPRTARSDPLRPWAGHTGFRAGVPKVAEKVQDPRDLLF